MFFTVLSIAATIGLCILTTNISVNFAIAKRTHENGYGGMGYGGMGYGGHGGFGGVGHGGAGPVIQGPVKTGNHHLSVAVYCLMCEKGRPENALIES
jgi:hypothetical protein